jgi:L,D-peptidoglycan transpeptidase YkuD (ErfK/YbiS/YcfS/YnhG family)
MTAAPDLVVTPDGRARLGRQNFRCALGSGGVRRFKLEGDGATPAGSFALRRLFYRRDRLREPQTGLPKVQLTPADGWCDDPRDRDYNRLVKRPFWNTHEVMWRGDHLYDLVVDVGYNDNPPIPGRGSAIFLHLARPDYGPTAGCVAFSKDDFLAILKRLGPTSRLIVEPR